MAKDVWVRVKREGAESTCLLLCDIRAVVVGYDADYETHFVQVTTPSGVHCLVTDTLDKCHRVANKLTDVLNIDILDLYS